MAQPSVNPFGISGAASYAVGGVTNFPIPKASQTIPAFLHATQGNQGRAASARRYTPGDESGRYGSGARFQQQGLPNAAGRSNSRRRARTRSPDDMDQTFADPTRSRPTGPQESREWLDALHEVEHRVEQLERLQRLNAQTINHLSAQQTENLGYVKQSFTQNDQKFSKIDQSMNSASDKIIGK